MGQEAVLDELVNAVLSFDADKVMDTAKKALAQEWVREIGGDGYAENVVEAVKVAKTLLNIKD